MKNFLKQNWFKLMTGTSMLVFSFAFLLYAVSPSYANYTKEENPSKSDYALVPLNKDGSINIKISEEQLEKLTSKPMDKIGGKTYIGCGSGIWYTSSSNPYYAEAWTKVD